MIKINYFNVGTKIINNLDKTKPKPKLLLHVCCAPCATFPLELLLEHFNVTIFYNNSNIYPESEYLKRYEELKDYVIRRDVNVTIIAPEYNNQAYTKKIAIRKDDREKGPRCHLCFFLRMEEAFKYADENGFNFFTTALTISPHKNAQIINKIGLILEKKFRNTAFLPHDFKKKEGTKKAVKLAKDYELYRQEYCGCVFSFLSSTAE